MSFFAHRTSVAIVVLSIRVKLIAYNAYGQLKITCSTSLSFADTVSSNSELNIVFLDVVSSPACLNRISVKCMIASVVSAGAFIQNASKAGGNVLLILRLDVLRLCLGVFSVEPDGSLSGVHALFILM